MSQAFVTLATNDEYCKGAVVVAKSLRNTGTHKALVCMITPSVSTQARGELTKVFDVIKMVDVLDSKDAAHLAMLKRPELGITFTKIHCWQLTQFAKCVFLDADTMVLSNVDDLFDNDELSAVPDCGWPDMFNSGMFVYKPSEQTYSELIKLASTEGSFDGGDQGLLNTYFTKWNRLSFVYNMQATTSYTYTPAFAKYGKNTKIVHFLGEKKPWKSGAEDLQFAKEWKQTFHQLQTGFENIQIGASSSNPQTNVEHYNMMRQGKFDPHGTDSFSNIQQKIDSQIKKGNGKKK